MRAHTRKYAAELIGTFVLTLSVLLSISGQTGMMTPIVAAITVGLFVYTVGNISGTHLNPAVTLALLSVKKINGKDAAIYILVQFVGAIAASFVIKQLTILPPGLTVGDSALIAFAEAVGAFILVFGIASVVYGKVHSAAAGAVIGGSLLLGIRLTDGLSNGILNPAVAVGIGSVSATYIIAPIIGAALAAWCYRWLVNG